MTVSSRFKLSLSLALGSLATAATAGDDPWALLSGVEIDEKIAAGKVLLTT